MPHSALIVALEMHAELERLCSELPYEAELTLHVGVTSGHGIARIKPRQVIARAGQTGNVSSSSSSWISAELSGCESLEPSR